MDLSPEALAQANVNPATYLATDYLNVFNEALMLIGLVGDDPDMLEELEGWSAPGYAEHFERTNFQGKEVVIAAYDAADPLRRSVLELRAKALEALIVAESTALATAHKRGVLRKDDVSAAIDMLQGYIPRLDALITGGAAASESTIDALFL